MKHFNHRLILAAAGIILLAGCDKAVKLNHHAAYIVQGDAGGALYPLDVTRDSEDVHIELKETAPEPAVFSIDTAGHATLFNATMNGHVLVVPGKFDRIELRHAGAAPVAILNGDTLAR